LTSKLIKIKTERSKTNPEETKPKLLKKIVFVEEEKNKMKIVKIKIRKIIVSNIYLFNI